MFNCRVEGARATQLTVVGFIAGSRGAACDRCRQYGNLGDINSALAVGFRNQWLRIGSQNASEGNNSPSTLNGLKRFHREAINFRRSVLPRPSPAKWDNGRRA
jgi:hypothetical protein